MGCDRTQIKPVHDVYLQGTRPTVDHLFSHAALWWNPVVLPPSIKTNTYIEKVTLSNQQTLVRLRSINTCWDNWTVIGLLETTTLNRRVLCLKNCWIFIISSKTYVEYTAKQCLLVILIHVVLKFNTDVKQICVLQFKFNQSIVSPQNTKFSL